MKHFKMMAYDDGHLGRFDEYGVVTISRVLKIIGLFCRISPLLWGSFAKETYHFKEPTNRSHPKYHGVGRMHKIQKI